MTDKPLTKMSEHLTRSLTQYQKELRKLSEQAMFAQQQVAAVSQKVIASNNTGASGGYISRPVEAWSVCSQCHTTVKDVDHHPGWRVCKLRRRLVQGLLDPSDGAYPPDATFNKHTTDDYQKRLDNDVLAILNSPAYKVVWRDAIDGDVLREREEVFLRERFIQKTTPNSGAIVFGDWGTTTGNDVELRARTASVNSNAIYTKRFPNNPTNVIYSRGTFDDLKVVRDETKCATRLIGKIDSRVYQMEVTDQMLAQPGHSLVDYVQDMFHKAMKGEIK